MIPLIKNCVAAVNDRELEIQIEVQDSAVILNMIHQYSAESSTVPNSNYVDLVAVLLVVIECVVFDTRSHTL